MLVTKKSRARIVDLLGFFCVISICRGVSNYQLVILIVLWLVVREMYYLLHILNTITLLLLFFVSLPLLRDMMPELLFYSQMLIGIVLFFNVRELVLSSSK